MILKYFQVHSPTLRNLLFDESIMDLHDLTRWNDMIVHEFPSLFCYQILHDLLMRVRIDLGCMREQVRQWA